MKLRNYYFFLLSCLMIISLFSCENEVITDQKTDTESSLIAHGVNPFFRTAKISELKSLKSFINDIETNSENFSSTTSKNDKHFSVLEEEDINVYSEKGITTYTIPIVKGDHSVNTVSNLVVRFSDTEEPRAFIIDYKTTQEFLNQKSINPLTPFQGIATYEAIDYDGSLDDAHARSGCYSVTYTFCNWGGSTHAAGQECTPSYMWNETVLFCPGPGGVYEEVIAAPDGPNSGGGSIPGGSGNVGNTSYPSISLQLLLKNMFGMNNLTPEIVSWIDDSNNALNAFEVWNFATQNTNAQGYLDQEVIDLLADIIEVFDDNADFTFEEALLYTGNVLVDTIPTKVDPAEELDCLDLTQGAKLTVYVQQPRENSDAVVGPNQVGHAFIGIEQGGVVRQVGYYPDREVGITGVGDDYDAAIKTNYDYLYHVSISQDVTSAQLTDIVNYATDFPSIYNTNNYACTDFAIAVGNLGGIGLPSTTVSNFTFEGRSPGKLGQEIRAMSSSSTTTITTTSGNSPTRQGPCLGQN